MSSYRNLSLQYGTKARMDVLQCYGHNTRYGHDTARRVVFEAAEVVADIESRERAASMLYEIADAIVGKLPLPETLFPPAEKPAPAGKSVPAPLSWRKLFGKMLADWALGFIAGFCVGRSF